MDLKYMQQLAGAVELEEPCGCEDDLAEGRAEAENAIWKFFPSDSKGKYGGHRKVMFTGAVAKAAKLPEYTSIKLSDLTDHQIQSVLAVIQKKGEDVETEETASFADFLSEAQLSLLDGLDDDALREAMNKLAENMLMNEATPDLVRHCVRAVGKKHGGDVSRAFAICNAQLQKAGYLKPNSMELTAKGKAREKQHDTDPDADAKFSEYEKMLKAAKKSEEGVEEASIGDGKHGYIAFYSTNSGSKELEVWADSSYEAQQLAVKAFKAPKSKQHMVHVKLAQKDGKQVTHLPLEGVTDRMRALLGLDEAPKKTYKQAQDEILTGLEKDGWSVKRDLKVPHATSPKGDFKLFFKAQAIYKTHGKGDLGNARSLHLPDIRQGDYSTFSSALGRWTGRDMKDQPLRREPTDAERQASKAKAQAVAQAAKAAVAAKDAAAAPSAAAPQAQLTPDQYHAKHGQCPDGYHFDDSTKRCVKAKSEAANKMCPKCKGKLLYDDGCDCYSCEECGFKGPNAPAEAVEVLRLAGVNRYPDRGLVKGERAFEGRAREYAGIAGAHEDWRLEALWHPNTHGKV